MQTSFRITARRSQPVVDITRLVAAWQAMALVGTAVPRTEAPRLLTGHGRFVDDLQPPGMLHAAFVRSHDAHGRLVSVHTEAARRAPAIPAAPKFAEPCALAM